MNIRKGYLQSVWDFAAAIIDNPKQAFADVWRGLDVEADRGKFFTAPGMLTFGGTGMALSGVLMANPLSVIAGVTAGLFGLGRYHALGEQARIVEEEFEIDMVLREGDRLIDELDRKFGVKDGPDVTRLRPPQTFAPTMDA